jgi:hypothetical protein
LAAVEEMVEMLVGLALLAARVAAVKVLVVTVTLPQALEPLVRDLLVALVLAHLLAQPKAVVVAVALLR